MDIIDIENELVSFDEKTKVYTFLLNGIKYTFKKGNKNQYFGAILYEENLIDNWEEKIEYIIPYPYFYIKHDKDIYYENDEIINTPYMTYENGILISNRKPHYHLVVCLENGTTTYNHMLELVNTLCKNTPKLIVIESVYAYWKYIQHIDNKSVKANKTVYPVDNIIVGNGFDIIEHIHLTQQQKEDLLQEISLEIIKRKISSYAELVLFGMSVSKDYYNVIRSYIPYFKEFLKGSLLLTTTSNSGQRTEEKGVLEDE